MLEQISIAVYRLIILLTLLSIANKLEIPTPVGFQWGGITSIVLLGIINLHKDDK